MDNRQLAVFLAVARAGSFTAAGAELHLVQSAVSARIAALEADLGEVLFDRTTRRVELTAAGRALVPHATAILDAFQAARDDVSAVTAGLSGTVRIGYMTNVTLVNVPRLLRRFSDDYPGVAMHMASATSGTRGLAEGLRAGELDVAFLSAAPQDLPDLDIHVLATSPLGLGVAVDHPLAGRRSLTLAETAGCRFVDLRDGFGTRTSIDAEFRRHGLHREVRIEASDATDAAALVRHGLGVGFLPRYLAEQDPHVRWIEITDAAMEMCVSVGTARDRALSAAAARLAALARSPQTVDLPQVPAVRR